MPKITGEYEGVQIVNPTSVESAWSELLLPGACDDTVSVTDADAIFEQSVANVLMPAGNGTLLVLALEYDDAVTSVTSNLVVNVFGRDVNGIPYRIQDANGTTDITMTIDATNDIVTGDGAAGRNVTVLKTLDVLGAKEVAIGVKTAINTDGDDALARLLGRMVN